MKDKKQISRRAFLRMAAATAVGAVAAACQPKTVIVREEVPVTQIVEVEKEITKIVAGTPVVETVIETKVIEKVVTATPIRTHSATRFRWFISASLVRESGHARRQLYHRGKGTSVDQSGTQPPQHGRAAASA